MIDELVRAASKSDWERARQLLYEHWQQQCPKIFAPNVDAPWEITHDEQAVGSSLFRPLAAAYCQDPDARTTSLLPLNEEAGTSPEDRRPGQLCGHVFKCGEPTYSCRECATDPTCVLCHRCFTNSVHKNHKYRMSTSSGSGYCDCGDSDAWKQGFACDLHVINDDNETALKTSVTVNLPEPLHTRIKNMTAILLQYSTQMICWENDENFPEIARNPPDIMPPYQTVLFNDETHTYDAVIRALDISIHCTRNQAMLLATIVDREGRSTVKSGMWAECDRVKNEIARRTQHSTNRRTEKSGPLLVKVLESAFVAHQAHAIQLLTWLNQQTEHFPKLSQTIGEVLLTVMAERGEDSEVMAGEDDVLTEETLLVRLMKNDRKMWKAARCNFHQMLMKTVLMHYDQKYEFSRIFLQLYSHLYNEFVDDDHEHDVSIVSLTVQFLTVPSIARRLIAEENAIAVVFEKLQEHTDAYLSLPKSAVSRFDFSQRSFPATLKRVMTMFRDQSYLLNNVPKPEEWTVQLRDNFVNGCAAYISFLHHMQGMDEMKRLSGEHQVWDPEWETAFNIQLRMQDILGMLLAWAASDKEVHHRFMNICLDAVALHKPQTTEPGEPGATKEIVSVNGEEAVVGSFDVLKGAVSIHQPIYRLLAGLFAVDRSFLRFLEKNAEPTSELELIVRKKVEDLGMDLYEMALRVFVLCAQSNAGLWRRNGFSLINQIHNYVSPLCRTEMFDKDLLLIQVGAALSKPSDFILHFLHRYRVAQWADEEYDGNRTTPFGSKVDPEESSKFIVVLAEDMYHMLIVIIGERWVPGVGECSRMDQLNREVIHILSMGPQPFSAINKRISLDPLLEKLSLDESVKIVGDFKKPTPSSPGTFQLKEGLRSQWNPFFYHYSKSDLSQAELYQEKARPRSDRALAACPPPTPIPFAPFFAPVRDLLKCPTLVRIHRVTLERVAKRSRFASDRLLHRVLYLVGMALHEQSATPEFDFVTEANKENILQKMEALNGKQESQSHADLLWWTIQKYREVERLARSENASAEITEENTEAVEENADALKKKRADRAAKMRLLALQKMQKMQKTFVESMTKEEKTGIGETEEEMVITPTFARIEEDEDCVTKLSDTGFPTCMGLNKCTVESIVPRSVKCILCQEEEILDANSKPFVCAAFVQKSHLFSQRSATASIRLDIHLVNAALVVGVDASTCSHTMHFECYQNLAESVMNRERNRSRSQAMLVNQKMIDADGGEYQCPLCKRLSNTAMPLIPALHLLSINGFSTNRPSAAEEFDDWIERVRELVVAPPQVTVKTPVKSHSRKRSHSERALNDLVKQAEKDEISSGSLDNALSSSVPSASTMDLLMQAEDMQRSSPGGVRPAERTLSHTTDVDQERGRIALYEMEARAAADHLNELFNDRAQTASPVSSPTSEDVSRRTGGSTSGKRSDAGKFFAAIPNNVLQIIMRMPHAVISKFTKRIIPLEEHEDMVRAFTKFVIKCRSVDGDTKELQDQVRGVMSAMSVWQSTSHVLRAVCAILQHERKPLFGALNTRQRDCIIAMSRLSALLSYNMQPFGEITCQLLKVLLCPPPQQPFMRSDGATSPPYRHPANPSPMDQSTPATTKLLTSPIAQLFLPSSSHSRKDHIKENQQHNVNLLHVDMLSLALELMMCIGWTWNDGQQHFTSSTKSAQRELIPDGSIDELFVLRLAMLGHLFQIFATFVDEEDTEMRDVEKLERTQCAEQSFDARDDDTTLRSKVCSLWKRVGGDELNDVDGLCKKLRRGMLDMLRPMALFYHSITLVPPPEALKDPYVDEMDALCRYLGLPALLDDWLESATTARLFDMWSAAIPSDPLIRMELVRQPIKPNMLIDLPEDFCDLINIAAKYRCPSIPLEEMASSIPTMCLVCGEIVCSQSYCCQKTVGKDTLGACQYHMSQCSGPIGVFLRIRDSQIALLASRFRGCFKSAPYVDEFGETDFGFRRGNPLHLNHDQYNKLRQLWLHQGIGEEVVNQTDVDHRNLAYEWNHF